MGTLRQEIDELRRAIHADHQCVPGRCECICGCQQEMACKVAFGPLCSVCMIRDVRGDEDHGQIECTADHS